MEGSSKKWERAACDFFMYSYIPPTWFIVACAVAIVAIVLLVLLFLLLEFIIRMIAIVTPKIGLHSIGQLCTCIV